MENYFRLALAAAVVGYMLYRVVRFGGWRASLFGATIVRTLGEVNLDSRAMNRTRFRVHILKAPCWRAPELEIRWAVRRTGAGNSWKLE